MHFRIEAELLQGEPRLRIFDADSGALRLQWRYRNALFQACGERRICDEDHLCAARANLRTLMRDLFLLSCVGKSSALGLAEASDACLNCDRCVSGGDAPLATLSRSALK